MGIFGGHKWRNAGDDLSKATKGAKEMIPNSVDDSVCLLFGAGPAERQAYQPYLDYLSRGNVPDELKKLLLMLLTPVLYSSCALLPTNSN